MDVAKHPDALTIVLCGSGDQPFRDHRLIGTVGYRIAPKRMRAPLALQIAAVIAQLPAAGHCVSLNRHRLTSNAPWEAAQCISATVFEDEGDRCGETLSRRRLCATLSIRTGHFGAIRDEPFAIALNDCREFVSHKAIIARENAGTRGRLTNVRDFPVPERHRRCQD
jgi:hypothetical protein